MARIPSGDDIERRLPRGGGSVYGVRPNNTGAALEAVGQKISAFGERMEEKADRLDIAKAKSFYLTERIKAERELEDEPDFMKWGDKYEQKLGEIAGQAKGMIRNSRQQELFDSEIAVDRARSLDGVFGKQKNRLKDSHLADLLRMGDENFAAIGATSDEATRANLLTAYKDAAMALRQKGVIDAVTEQKLTRDYANRYGVLEGTRTLQNSPELILGIAGGGASDAGGNYEAKVGHFENAGRDGGTPNQDTGATGKFQFIDGTWLAQIKKHAPEAVAGKSEKEILALRTDPTIARKVFEGFTKDNESALSSAGLPVNDTTRYLAHWFGAGGAAELLKADPSKPISDFLPKGLSKTGKTWAAANGIEGKTVGQVIGIAEQRMGAPVATQASFSPATGDQPAPAAKRPAWWNALTPEQQLKLSSEAAAVVERKRAIERVEAEKVYVQGATQQMVDRFGTDEAAALAYIRQNYTGEAQNKLVASTRDRMGEMRRLDRESKDGRFSAAAAKIRTGQMLTAEDEVAFRDDPQSLDTLRKMQRDKLAGVAEVTDHAWLFENYYNKTEDDRRKIPLSILAPRMTYESLEKIAEARKKEQETDPSEISESEAFNNALKLLGYDTKQQEGIKKADAFNKAYVARIRESGKPMSSEEKRNLLNKMVGEVRLKTSGGSFFGLGSGETSGREFKFSVPGSDEFNEVQASLAKRVGQAVPPEALQVIMRKLRERKQDFSMENVERAYWQGANSAPDGRY